MIFGNKNEKFEWKENLNSQEWDELISLIEGHPLQSALWGNTRNAIDNIREVRWVAFYENKPVYIVRCEERRFLKFIKVAWIPQGPIVLDRQLEDGLQKELFLRLKKRGFFICGMSPWREVNISQNDKSVNYTIWVDFSIGRDKLWDSLSKAFRYDVKRGERENVKVVSTQSKEDVIEFYTLCEKTSFKKNFFLNTNHHKMLHLLQNPCSQVKAHLFVARYNEKIGAGAFIIRAGETIHYVWGTTDRLFAKQRVGEVLHWKIMEWAIEQGCKKYDLGGVIPQEKNGNFNFKKKLGGRIVALSGEKVFPLRRFLGGSAFFARLYCILKPKLNRHHSKSLS